MKLAGRPLSSLRSASPTSPDAPHATQPALSHGHAPARAAHPAARRPAGGVLPGRNLRCRGPATRLRARVRARHVPHRLRGARAMARRAFALRPREDHSLRRIRGASAALHHRGVERRQHRAVERGAGRHAGADRCPRHDRRRGRAHRARHARRRLAQSRERRQRVGGVRDRDPDELPARGRHRLHHAAHQRQPRHRHRAGDESGEPRALRRLVQRRAGRTRGDGGPCGCRAQRPVGVQHQQQPLPDRSQSRRGVPHAAGDARHRARLSRLESRRVHRPPRPDEEHVLPTAGRGGESQRDAEPARLDDALR